MTRTPLVAAAALLALAAPLAAQDRQQPFNLDAEGENGIGYTQAIRVGDVLYLSGTVGRGATLEEQMASAYRNIARTLEHYGATLADVVRETIYTTDMEALQRAIPARKVIYGNRFPAATWVQVERLFSPPILLEIEITAVIGSGTAPR